MMDSHSSFQSERHNAPYFDPFIRYYHAKKSLGRASPGMLGSKAAVLFWIFRGCEMWSAMGEGLGSVMRNVSKAKFDGSLLQFALLERVE